MFPVSEQFFQILSFFIPRMASFVEYPETSDFPIENIPFGVFSTAANVSAPTATHSHSEPALVCERKWVGEMVEWWKIIEASHACTLLSNRRRLLSIVTTRPALLAINEEAYVAILLSE